MKLALRKVFIELFGWARGRMLRKSYVIGSFFKLQEAKKESAREVEQLLNQADIVCI